MKRLGRVFVGNFDFQITECACYECQAMCQNVCWPLPQEAVKLIEAGYADRLCIDDHVEYERGERILSVKVLAPREKGDPSRQINPVCTFFTCGKCEIHNSGMKPIEARIVSHRAQPDEHWLRTLIGREWNTPVGRETLKLWEDETRKQRG